MREELAVRRADQRTYTDHKLGTVMVAQWAFRCPTGKKKRRKKAGKKVKRGEPGSLLTKMPAQQDFLLRIGEIHLQEAKSQAPQHIHCFPLFPFMFSRMCAKHFHYRGQEVARDNAAKKKCDVPFALR